MDDAFIEWLTFCSVINAVEHLEPEVKIESLSIMSPGRPDLVLPLPLAPNTKGPWFTLKEGSPYKLKFSFSVSNNIVPGLRYSNTVWKTGVKGERRWTSISPWLPHKKLFYWLF